MSDQKQPTIQEAYEAKLQLEQEIRAALVKFTQLTFIEVEGISISAAWEQQSYAPMTYAVEVDAKLLAINPYARKSKQ